MGYKHYGNIGDIWKHLPLCSFLKNESPRWYIETNSAKPFYHLDHNPARNYGIYTFFERIQNNSLLQNTEYVKLLQNVPNNQKNLKTYLGSPGLAMKTLSSGSEKFIFYDIEKEPLIEIQDYAKKLGLESKVETRCEDSIRASYELLNELAKQDFIHFDPYYAFEEGEHGLAYIDVFLKATSRNVKCMLWYAYFTLQEKREIAKKLNDLLKKYNINVKKKKIRNIEIYLDIIQEDDIVVNPGVLGCGVLISNLSAKSRLKLDELSTKLVKIYKGTTLFDKYPGDLKRDVIF